MSERPSSRLPKPTNEHYAALVDRCVDGVVQALGARNLRAVLLIGAPARGEATVADTPAGPYSLSDVDLVCLCAPKADLISLRARLRKWVVEINSRLSAECTGVDASLRAHGPKQGLHPLIATYEMLRSPAVVWGNEDIRGELPMIEPAQVPDWDSLVLFHNRTVEQVLMIPSLEPIPPVGDLVREWRGAGEDPAATKPSGGPRPPGDRDKGDRDEGGRDVSEHALALRLLYTSGKFLLDSVTALLFLDGEVPETYAERVGAFSQTFLSRPENALLREAISEFLPDLEAWSRFKSTGDFSALKAALPLQPEGPRKLARGCLSRYARCSGDLWRAIVGRVVGVQAEGLSVKEVTALYSRLESPARTAARAAKMLRSPAGRAGLFSTFRIVRNLSFTSPRQLAYLTAVLTYQSLSDRANAGELSDLVAELCPFRMKRGFRRLRSDGRREAIVERLSLFQAAVLRGRSIERQI